MVGTELAGCASEVGGAAAIAPIAARPPRKSRRDTGIHLSRCGNASIVKNSRRKRRSREPRRITSAPRKPAPAVSFHPGEQGRRCEFAGIVSAEAVQFMIEGFATAAENDSRAACLRRRAQSGERWPAIVHPSHHQRRFRLLAAAEAAGSESRHLLTRWLAPEVFVMEGVVTLGLRAGDLVLWAPTGRVRVSVTIHLLRTVTQSEDAQKRAGTRRRDRERCARIEGCDNGAARAYTVLNQ